MNFPMRAESLYQYEIMVKMVEMPFSLTPFQILIESICWPFVIVPKTDKNSDARFVMILFILAKI